MHLMYVDESGDTGFPKPGALFPDTGGPTRQFVRSGVIVHSWKWQQVDHAISQFKRARNMAWDAEIKANVSAILRFVPSNCCSNDTTNSCRNKDIEPES